MSIIDLQKKIQNLRTSGKTSAFDALYHVSWSEGNVIIPPSFEQKVMHYFAERDETGLIIESKKKVLQRLSSQKLVRVHNTWTDESALFNSLRASRPGVKRDKIDVERIKAQKLIDEAKKDCDFCQPELYTPADTFGRIEGKYCITSANVAKYDAFHAVILFKNHDPLDFSRDALADYFAVGFKWLETVHVQNPDYIHPFFVWNCLGKAGASLVHGHAQVLMATQLPYAKVHTLMVVADKYQKTTGHDYFLDLSEAHQCVDLMLEVGAVKVLAYLTPVKEKEIKILVVNKPSENETVIDVVYKILRYYIDELGVLSFNLAISMPPISESSDFPYMISIVDRGSLFKPTSDIGGMELYGSTVIASDPFLLAEELRGVL